MSLSNYASGLSIEAKTRYLGKLPMFISDCPFHIRCIYFVIFRQIVHIKNCPVHFRPLVPHSPGLPYIRAKRNVALDRLAFEEQQGPSESFDDFFIGLRRLADAADLCET
jgi:hypothetical protein